MLGRLQMLKQIRRRLMMIAVMGSVLGLGVFIGLAIDRLWNPRDLAGAVVPVAHGAVRGTAVDSRDTAKARPKSEITDIVETVSPSVVTVGAIKRTLVAQRWYDDFLFAPRIRLREANQRVPYMGSGFLIDRDGHIITNYHVIEDSESLFVTFPDGREMSARLVEHDSYIDLALLKIEAPPADLPEPLEFADSEALRIGEQVVAFGNPFGNLMEDTRPTVTVGYVSALKRMFRPDQQNKRVYQDMIQTDAAINPGNSGGPLVDMEGRVVGVNTFIFSTSGGSAGIGFAIPARRVIALVHEVKTHGRLRNLLLDFAFRTAGTPAGNAVLILGVEPNGPASRAGLEPGDLILKVENRPVASREELYLLFASRQIGDRLRFEVRKRNGEVREIEYEVSEAPAQSQAALR